MDAGLQHVNLLPSLEPPEIEMYLPVARVKKLLVVWVVLLLIIGLLASWQLYGSKQKLNAARVQRAKVVEVVKQLEAVPDKQVDDELQGTVDKLAERVNNTGELVALLSSEKVDDHSGFSRYLKAIAQKVPKGIWLTRIIIADEGVLLRGKSKSATMVAGFAHDLQDTEPFSTVEFKRIDIDRDKTKGTVVFDIATSKEMEEQD